MRKIDVKLRPFSHVKGSKCLLPGTNLVIQAYPDLICIGDEKIVLPNDPLDREFTLLQDWEKLCVWVFGNGYRIQIKAEEQKIVLQQNREKRSFAYGGRFLEKKSVETLCLGVHKKQDWDLMQRRCDSKELLPFIFMLSQQTPSVSPNIFQKLCLRMSNVIQKSALDWPKSYLLDFEHAACPKHQGIFFEKVFQGIRSLFFDEQNSRISFFLRREFPKGRLCHVQSSFGLMHLLWSCSTWQEIEIHPTKNKTVYFSFLQNIASFRVRSNRHEKGYEHLVKDPLSLVSGQVIYLDRFYI